MVSRKNCGIDNDNVPDTRLQANGYVQQIKTRQMRYREADQFKREYDACFYEINVDPFIDPKVLSKIR